MFKIKQISIYIIIIYLFINCSTPQHDEKKDVEVNDITINEVSNRTPVVNLNQVDLELLASVNEENFKQDIEYNWEVEYLKLDIESDSSLYTSNNVQNKENSLTNKYLEGYYLLDVSKKNPLNALLSIYQEGFYRVTLKTSGSSNLKEYSVVVKIGEPPLPNLFVKVNIPKLDKLNKSDYIGKFYFSINNNELDDSEIHELNATEMQDKWFNTGLIINPFDSFNIVAGTHVLNDNLKSIVSALNNKNFSEFDSITYSLDNSELENISLTPLIIKGNNHNNFKIKKSGTKSWLKGDVYISLLTWKDDNSKYDKFIYSKKILNSFNTQFIANLKGVYLSKVFIGSFGHKVPYNNYYIYFGPEGTNLDELDPNNNREYPGLPYGYLLGRLGNDGKVFPISNNFKYETNKKIIKVLSF